MAVGGEEKSRRGLGSHREAVVAAAVRREGEAAPAGTPSAPQGARGADGLGLKIGDDIVHDRFGEGVIVDLEGQGAAPLSRKSLTISTFPPNAALFNNVKSSPFCRWILAPWLKKYWTNSRLPREAAILSGVIPRWPRVLRLAPAFANRWTTAVCPPCTALLSAVRPT